MKKLSLLIAIFILFTSLFCTVQAEAPSINEGSGILIDAKTGQVLYEHNSGEKGLFPASTTKIMTALLAIEKGDPDSIMTASQTAVNDIGKDGSNIGIMAGEQIALKYLLQALMISSANETANIIAENICSTRQEFVDLMNQKAKELGALDTHFANPCGSHDPDHYTTAADLAKIARYAMTLPEFRKIVEQVSFQMPPTNKHETWPVLSTTNILMRQDKSEIYKINGVKTGFTGPAGYNLVSSAVNPEGMELISVVMNIKNDGISAQTNVRKYSKELLDYGFNNFSLVTLQADSQVYKSVAVEDAADEMPLDLLTRGKVQYVLPKDTDLWNIKEIPVMEDKIAAPVNKDDVLGYVEFQKDGQTIGKVELIASRPVELKPQAKLMNNLENLVSIPFVRTLLIVTCVLIPSFLVLRVVLRTISRRINSTRRRF